MSDPTPLRRCAKCQEMKPLDQFPWDARSKAAPDCKVCRREYNRNYQRRRRQDKPEVVRRSNLWRLYKITPEQYDALRSLQQGRCAVCGIHEDDIDLATVGGRPCRDGSRRMIFPLAVDHCHSTGRIRGLLCPPCNRALGVFKDDPELLRSAARYLERVVPDLLT